MTHFAQTRTLKPGASLAEGRRLLASTELSRRRGQVRKVAGLAIDAQGPVATLGELCRIRRAPAGAELDAELLAEVVGIQPGHVTLMPYGALDGIGAGCEVEALGEASRLAMGPGLLGRVIDGFGAPLDGGPPPRAEESRALRGAPSNPMKRPPIDQLLETGIRAIDGLFPIGKGQRMGIFAGSGVGKSTLLGMIARHVRADINVIALIGERGREVRQFVEQQLGAEGLRRSVVVVATADQPALARLRATHAAFAIAEYFRDQGQDVLLTVDSLTRFAMARREVGLSAGEPPTARGYTPSVFAELPRLCERCGTREAGGSITALLTVLVEGDDMNEPVADNLRAILDGHLVLSRELAHRGQYPAIDPLQSVSRLAQELSTPADRNVAREAIRLLALLERNQSMVEIGAYESGAHPELDAALERQPLLQQWLTQSEGGADRTQALAALRTASTGPRPVSAAPRKAVQAQPPAPKKER